LNGNKDFESNEKLIAITCGSAGSENTQNFTIPDNALPGTHRFRLVTKYDGTPAACSNTSYGQTHDYTFIITEYPRAQNVVAEFTGSTITVTWEAPEEGTPDGYNIYRNGSKLNDEPLTETIFTVGNITEGVYAYSVTAVYGTKESYAETSNVICNFAPCEMPLELTGIDEEKTAILTWSEPEGAEGLLGYNLYRDEVKINETLIEEKEYRDEELENGTYIYKVSAIYENLCYESELTDGVSVTIDYIGINDFQASSYNIYPNPTTGEFHVTSDKLQVTNTEIFDIYGRKCHTSRVTRQESANVSHLQSGVYFVKIFSDDGVVVVKRLVIMK
jgi:hypothetical protein